MGFPQYFDIPEGPKYGAFQPGPPLVYRSSEQADKEGWGVPIA